MHKKSVLVVGAACHPPMVKRGGGLASLVELYCCTERCRSVCGIHYEDFQCHCLATWHLAHGVDTRKIAPAFSRSREKAAKEKFRSYASETLLIFPLVLNFAETLVSNKRGLCRLADRYRQEQQADRRHLKHPPRERLRPMLPTDGCLSEWHDAGREETGLRAVRA